MQSDQWVARPERLGPGRHSSVGEVHRHFKADTQVGVRGFSPHGSFLFLYRAIPAGSLMHGEREARMLLSNWWVGCVGIDSRHHTNPIVGASLLAKASAHSALLQAEPPLSRASPLPQVLQRWRTRRTPTDSRHSSPAGSWSAGNGQASSYGFHGRRRTSCSHRTPRGPGTGGSSWSRHARP